ncbi:MAG: hypothetical protein ACMUIA_02565 [bacterium]
MSIILHFIGIFLDLIIFPFRGIGPFWGFFAVSVVMGAMAVIIFKYISNQARIKQVKGKIKTHFLAIRLYKDDFREILRAQKEILKNNFWYVVYSFQAAIPIIILVLLTISQLNLRYGYTSIEPGETFQVKVTFAQDADRRPEPQLVLPEGIEAVTPALYLGGEEEVSWQLRAVQEGRHRLGVKVCDQEFTKEVVIGCITAPFCPQLMRAGFLATLVNSAEPPLPKHARLESIEVGYKPRYFTAIVFGWKMHWLLVFPIIAIGFGLIFRKILKVD